jgi:hypothetical protein
MNSWVSRIATALAFGLMQWMHSFIEVPNNPEGLLIYHGSAALFDLAAIFIASELLTGQLARDLNCLTLASIGINGLGWAGYLLYLDPIWYDSALTSLIIVSYLRLFVTRGGDVIGNHGGGVFRPCADNRPQSHQKEATQ